MEISETILEGVKIIHTNTFNDQRGFFRENYHKQRYDHANIPGSDLKFVQDNVSFSKQNVLRGLHFQLSKPQGKLVSVNYGEVFDVVVDVNPKSKTFRKWIGVNLTGSNGKQLWIPPGYAHGFCVISEQAIFTYKCTEFYDVNLDIGLNWKDSQIGIDWPTAKPIISKKDQALPTLDKLIKLHF